MRIEHYVGYGKVSHWYRVIADDESTWPETAPDQTRDVGGPVFPRAWGDGGPTVAFCRTRAVAVTLIEAIHVRQYLLNACRINCAGREAYRGKLRHVTNCPVYDLDLADNDDPEVPA